jgi:hypothetical protein
MSIRIATATNPTQRSIVDAPILRPRGAKDNAPKVVGIAGLLAAVLTANIADAATSRHHRASMPERGWVAHHAPYDRGISAPSQVTPFSGRGIFEQSVGAP